MHEHIKATDLVNQHLYFNTQQEIADKIGITRQTLSKRIKDNLWKKSEIIAINQIK